MSLLEKAKAKGRARLESIVRPVLEEGEELRVAFPAAKGPNIWASWLLLGPIGILLLWKSYTVALTDRRLILIAQSMTGKPRGVALSTAISEAAVVRFKKAHRFPGWGRLGLVSGQARMTLIFAWAWQEEARVVRDTLGRATHGAAMPPAVPVT